MGLELTARRASSLPGGKVAPCLPGGSRLVRVLAPCCDDGGMTALTQDQIAAKIATAESGFAAATSQYDRNVFAQIRDEYRRYSTERAKVIATEAAAASSAAS